MYDLISQRKSGHLLGISLLATIFIGLFQFLPTLALFRPFTFLHNGIFFPFPDRIGYVSREYDADLSSDGNLVVFSSNANSLLHSYSGSNKGLFLYNHQTGNSKQISTGLWHPNISIERPRISGNGRYIIFLAVNLNKQITKGIYLYDTQLPTTKEIILPENIDVSRSSSFDISQDGRYLSFFTPDGSILIYDQNTDSFSSFSNHSLETSKLYDFRSFRFLPDNNLLFHATHDDSDLYGLYSVSFDNYSLIPTTAYLEKYTYSGRFSYDILSFSRTNERSRLLLSQTADGQTAVFAREADRPELGDVNLTTDLNYLNRKTGEINIIPSPNWKMSAFIILVLLDTVLAGYLLFTDSAGKRPFPTA